MTNTMAWRFLPPAASGPAGHDDDRQEHLP